jgi:hypothetical protein
VSPQQWGWGHIGTDNIGQFMIHQEAHSAKQNILIQQKEAFLCHTRTATTTRIEFLPQIF